MPGGDYSSRAWQIAAAKLSVEELRSSYVSREKELNQLRSYKRAISGTLAEQSKIDTQTVDFEKRLLDQATEIDRLQTLNHRLSEKNLALKAHLVLAKLAANKDKPKASPQTPLRPAKTLVEANTRPFQQPIKDVSRSANFIDIKPQMKNAVLDKIVDVKRPATSAAADSPAKVVKKDAQVQTDPSAESLEAEKLRRAVQGYFFQFSGKLSNGGKELEWLTKRAESLRFRQQTEHFTF
jgi:hypothetical protein